ncbi:MAG TPA: ABC transporter substrate-binding protein [Longimicrobium sp.]|jgi:branched-chain amino acid transport system substrate-binding protein
MIQKLSTRRKGWRTRVWAMLAAAAAAACGPNEPGAARDELAASGRGDVVVAAVWPWSQRKEILFQQGLEMAVDEVNAAGGIRGRPLRLMLQDDQGSVNTGLLIAQKLASDPKVSAVIGHLQSHVTVPAARVYELNRLLLVSPTSTSPELTGEGYHFVFRTIFNDQDTGRKMAEYAARRRLKRVVICYVRNPYGRSVANAFEERAAELGIEVVGRASYDAEPDLSNRPFAAALENWKQVAPDGIFVAGQVPMAGDFITEVRKAGITIPVLGTDAMVSSALFRGGASTVEGTVLPVPFHADERRAEVRAFVAAFRKRFGVAPDPGAALGYDAVKLLAQAMSRAKNTSAVEVAHAMRHMGGFHGVTGTLSFDSRGDLVTHRILKVVARGGRFEYLPEAEDSVSAPGP